jgi:hypothetical protein
VVLIVKIPKKLKAELDDIIETRDVEKIQEAL